MLKPHRLVIDRVSGYADEAVAFLRRRRLSRRPFARVQGRHGEARAVEADSELGRRMFAAAAGLIDPDAQNAARAHEPSGYQKSGL